MTVCLAEEDMAEVDRQRDALDIPNRSKWFRRMLWGDGERGPAWEMARSSPAPEPSRGRGAVCLSITAGDRAEMRRQMRGLRLYSWSGTFRTILWAAAAAVDAGGIKPDPAVVRARDEIAGLAGKGPEACDTWPVLSKAGYRLAAAVARHHMKDLAAGVLPVTEADARAAGMDPHGMHALKMYMDVLPEFFGAVLGTAPPKVDVRHEALSLVNGQLVGAVCGTVLSVVEDYDYRIKRMLKLRVKTAGQTLEVYIPHSIGGCDIREGMDVYAGGAFKVSKGKKKQLSMIAVSWRLARAEGFESVYGLAERWGASEEAAAGVVERMRQLYRKEGAAEKMAVVFCRYAEMYKGGPDAMLRTFDGFRIRVTPDLLRSEPPGDGGLAECLGMWGKVTDLLGRAGIFPKWALFECRPAPRGRRGYG